jgi:hypothetical protein
MNSLLSPLGKNYCSWFYLLSFVNLVFIFILIIGLFITFVSKDREMHKHTYPIFYSLIGVFLTYFQSRLLYGMCLNSLK